MIFLLFFSFISGLFTILAPCIWPILPIVLSSASTGGKRKPLGITIGIVASFAIFTLSISYLVASFHFDPNILRMVAVVVIGLLGFSLLVPQLAIVWEGFASSLTGKIGANKFAKSHGFFGGLFAGLVLGIVWSPCAGPILATIASLGATRAVTLDLILVTAAYTIGVGIPLFIFTLVGTKILTKSRFLTPHTGKLQQFFGILTILTAISIYTNYDKVLQAKLLDYFPSYTNALYKLEGSDAVTKGLQSLKGTTSTVSNSTAELSNLGPAPEFTGITQWLNTNPLTISSLRGKVVLVDFWTYTCINCIRTLPYVASWYEKYKSQGLVVVGVHTPEFEFEKKTANVEAAIKQYNIHYPVAQDNNYSTWNAFNNQYWPAKYLVDAKGNIRYTHFGEGEYDSTEKAIQQLLAEAGNKVGTDILDIPDQTPKNRLSPETYLGSRRMEFFYPNGSLADGKQTLTLRKTIPVHTFSLGGEWTITPEYAESGKNATLAYNFIANKVFLVLAPTGKDPVRVRVSLDGIVVDDKVAGNDVKNGIITIDSDRLYNLIDLEGQGGNHVLLLEFQSGNAQAFAFTFG